MLLLLVGIRKLLDFVFTRHELKVLDDVFPQSKRKEKMEEEEERRKSIDYGIPASENSDNNLGKDIVKRGSFVHFEEETFPNYGDTFNDDGAIHIKTSAGLHNSALQYSDPDILKQ